MYPFGESSASSQPVQANFNRVFIDPNHTARFCIENHDNPIANGAYIVFWSTGVHMEVNQHKIRFGEGGWPPNGC